MKKRLNNPNSYLVSLQEPHLNSLQAPVKINKC